jgi:hypothetical protein
MLPIMSGDATTNPLLPSPLGMAGAFSPAGASVSMSATALLQKDAQLGAIAETALGIGVAIAAAAAKMGATVREAPPCSHRHRSESPLLVPGLAVVATSLKEGA